MKIFTCSQIKEIDRLTIISEPVSSFDLMERAAQRLFDWYSSRFGISDPIYIFSGPGNNGGDGLALARLLSDSNYNPEVWSLEISAAKSKEWEHNYNRLRKETAVDIRTLSSAEQFPLLKPGSVIIDAIFGSGLSRPPEGLAAQVIQKINGSGSTVISVDIPSGLSGDDNTSSDPLKIVHATFTLSFQFPKLSFLFAENEQYTGEWSLLDIGLHQGSVDSIESPYSLVCKDDVLKLLRRRKKFDHKGTFGHGLLVAGSYGKMGAALLASRAAMHTGIGLLTCHVPVCGNMFIQGGIPEAMVSYDTNEKYVSGPIDAGNYTAAGVGPGLGTLHETQLAIHSFLKEFRKPVVIDADGLNILSMNKEWISDLTPGSILTPHVKEFERLVGTCGNGFMRLKRQIEFSAETGCIVVLKGAYTSITEPGGRVFFNSTGNPGMATAGSGDTLTGMILSLLSQGYSPVDAAITGVYIHGLAGDMAAEESSPESVTASDIIFHIGNAFSQIRGENIH